MSVELRPGSAAALARSERNVGGRFLGAPFVFSALGGFLFGYDNGGIAGSLLFIRRDFALSPVMVGTVVSSLVLGAFIAAGIAGKMTNRYGPRRLLILAGAILTLGSAGAALSVNAAMLIAARIVIGLGIGTATVQVPIYLAEMAPTRIRGRLTALFQIMVATGILIAYFVSYGLSGIGAWRIMLAVAIIPSLLLLIGMWLQPESPRWLCRNGRVEEARAVLLLRRDVAETDRELADIQSTSDRPEPSLGAIMRDKLMRRALLVAVVLSLLQQVTGITTITYYAPTIFRAAGFGESTAILTAAGLGGLTLVCTITCSLIVDRVGRRPLMMWGATSMAVSMIVLGIFFSRGSLDTTLALAVAVCCIALFKISFAFSWGPLVWVLLPEVLPSAIRGKGMGVATSVNWVATLVIVFLFPVMLAIGAGAIFLVFALAAAVAALFIKTQLRETAQVSLEQIEMGR